MSVSMGRYCQMKNEWDLGLGFSARGVCESVYYGVLSGADIVR